MYSNMDDIEDIIGQDDVTPQERYQSRKNVVPKLKRTSRIKYNIETLTTADSVIPGTQSIYVKTWGCSHNNSDGEYMAGQLAAYGYKIVGEQAC